MTPDPLSENYELKTSESVMADLMRACDTVEELRARCNILVPEPGQTFESSALRAHLRYVEARGAALGSLSYAHRLGFIEADGYHGIRARILATAQPSR